MRKSLDFYKVATRRIVLDGVTAQKNGMPRMSSPTTIPQKIYRTCERAWLANKEWVLSVNGLARRMQAGGVFL